MSYMDPQTVPKFILSSGEEIPSIGLGTFGSERYAPDEIADAVYHAVRDGYRLIDCASVYGNEAQIGTTFRRLLEEGTVTREELFVISKVWNDSHREVERSCRKSLSDLGLSTLDLYFLHWPFPNYKVEGYERNPESRPFSLDEFLDTWRQCERLVDEGLVRYLGMSNMTIPKLEAVLPHCRIKPAALELECHPGFQQKELVAYAKKEGMIPVGFCPIGAPSRPARNRTQEDVADLELPEITGPAERRKVHPAEICLKWAYQNGILPIPFSVKEAQLRGNLRAVTEDLLTGEELDAIASVKGNTRLIKGQVFLWPEAKGWEDLWDMNGTITVE